MSKARVVVLEVTSGRLSVTAASRTYGLSRQHIYRLLQRYHQDGLEAVDPRSRRPASNSRAVSNEVIATVVLTRKRDLESGIAFANYDELADRCLELLDDEQAHRELGERGYRAFSARSQAAILRPALSASIE